MQGLLPLFCLCGSVFSFRVRRFLMGCGKTFFSFCAFCAIMNRENSEGAVPGGLQLRAYRAQACAANA